LNGVTAFAEAALGFTRCEFMAGERDCPLCGTAMRLKEREDVVRIPGSPQLSSKQAREWVCPECDYFEEAEEEGA
jgi:rubredoxin